MGILADRVARAVHGCSLSRASRAVKGGTRAVEVRSGQAVTANPPTANAWRPDDRLVRRAFADGDAGRWGLPVTAFADALERSARRAFEDAPPDPARLERYVTSLHLKDLAIACACADGAEPAWDHFVREYRPILYRAADAIDPSGGAREAADSLYAELFGLQVRDGARQSHFRYFHGRSSLGTWLRAVLSQRYVDRLRSQTRLAPLPADDEMDAMPAASAVPDGAASRCVEIMRRAIAAVVGALTPRDRLRLQCYYAQDLTLAQIGAVLGEHEATVSRNLARTRKTIRADVERALRDRERMTPAEIAECVAAVAGDSGSLDLAEMLGTGRDP
jgi:RNA polymerase sigma-70 factor